MIVGNGQYYLYRHIRLDKNKPFYIGIGQKRRDFFKYFQSEYQRAFSKRNRNSVWRGLVKQHEYVVEILLESNDRGFICTKEKELIKLYGRLDLKTGSLCNMCEGGEDYYSFKEVNSYRPREGYNSKKSYLYSSDTGVFITSFDKLQSLCNFTGLKDNRIGIFCQENIKYKHWIFSFKYLGEQIDVNEFKERISNGIAKPVYKIDIVSGEIVNSFLGCPNASESVGLTTTAIAQAIKYKRESGGFFWSYSKDNDISKYKERAKESPVRKIDPNTKHPILEFKTISEAARFEGLTAQSIWIALNNRTKCKKHFWEYIK